MAGVATGKMTSKATFIKNVPVAAGAGFKDVYFTLFTSWGNLRKKSGGRRLEAGEIVIDSTHEFTCRFTTTIDADLNNRTKLVIGDRTFTIADWHQEEEKNFYYKFQLNASEETITVSAGGGITTTDMESVTISASRSAETADAGKYIFLNGTTEAVDYTIDPAAMILKTFKITCINNTFPVTVIPESGTINGAANYEMNLNEEKAFYSDGTNIIIVP